GSILIPFFDEQPGLLSQPFLSDEREFPAQFLSEQQKTQFPLVQLRPYLLLHFLFGFAHKGPVSSLIPDDDFSCSILTLSNHPFEGSILEGMICNLPGYLSLEDAIWFKKLLDILR